MPVSSIHLGPFSRSKAGQRMSQCRGELTARRLRGSSAFAVHTRYNTYVQNEALPFPLCCQRFQPVLGCGECWDAFCFSSPPVWAGLAADCEEVDVIF